MCTPSAFSAANIATIVEALKPMMEAQVTLAIVAAVLAPPAQAQPPPAPGPAGQGQHTAINVNMVRLLKSNQALVHQVSL